jgi:polyisoprenoid-binding protein YceI
MSTVIEQVPTGTYALDTVHSSIGFAVKYNIGTFRSTFAEVDASLVDGVLTGTAQVSSVNIDQPQFKQHLLAEDFFHAEATPEITFRSTEIRPGADGTVEVDGELSIRGVTKAVTATGSYSTAFRSRRRSIVASSGSTGRTSCPTAATRLPGRSSSRPTFSSSSRAE